MKKRMDVGAIGRHLSSSLRNERGLVIVVVMVFCLIFLIIGVALYWLSVGQTRATETERKDVKAFNVAEAGVDAGMLALKLEWPFTQYDYVMVDGYQIKTELQEENSSLYDPERSDPSEFLQVEVYDNSIISGETYQTVTIPPDPVDRVIWDANGDGMMYVDASSNVQDSRHRILLLAERQVWNLYFPVGTALWANEVDSNGQGYGIEIEDGSPPVYYDVNDVQGKGIDEGTGVSTAPTSTEFDEVVTDAIIRALMGMAIQKGTYFTDDGEAETFLQSSEAPGSVVYVKSNTAVEIEGSEQMGTVEEPIVVVIDCTDAPEGTEVAWDMRGSADFYGILVVLGDTVLRGTSSIHGALYSSGGMLNKGTGNTPELNYNETVVTNINRQYVLSVNIVPNTWEEYTVPDTE